MLKCSSFRLYKVSSQESPAGLCPILYVCHIIAVLSTTLPPLKGKSSLKISSRRPLNSQGWWQRHGENHLILLCLVQAGPQGYCQSPGLEVVVLAHDSTAGSISSSLLPCPAHQFAQQPFQHLLRMSCMQGRQGHLC